MKVKLLTSRAGDTVVQNVGQIIEVSDEEGNALIDSGQAETTTKKERAVFKQSYEKAADAS